MTISLAHCILTICYIHVFHLTSYIFQDVIKVAVILAASDTIGGIHSGIHGTRQSLQNLHLFNMFNSTGQVVLPDNWKLRYVKI